MIKTQMQTAGRTTSLGVFNFGKHLVNENGILFLYKGLHV